MLFSVLHLPPLPALVHKVDEDDHSLVVGEKTESSHSLLGNMLDWCAVSQDHDKNMERMAAQVRCVNNFMNELMQLDSEVDLRTCNINRIYDLYCRHTREWFWCYGKRMGDQLYTRPWDYVVVGDKVHKNMCDYTKAQFYHMTLGNSRVFVDEKTSYGELMRQCAILRAGMGSDSCSWVGGSSWSDESGCASFEADCCESDYARCESTDAESVDVS